MVVGVVTDPDSTWHCPVFWGDLAFCQRIEKRETVTDQDPQDGWELVYSLRLPEPTILLNRWTRMHHRQKTRHISTLQWAVLTAYDGRPIRALAQCWIHVKRGNPRPFPDLDGLIGGLKPLLDVLVLPRARNPYGLGFIQDDCQSVLCKLTAESVVTPRRQGYTQVDIYQPAASGVC